jgi:hypothetical protein
VGSLTDSDSDPLAPLKMLHGDSTFFSCAMVVPGDELWPERGSSSVGVL